MHYKATRALIADWYLFLFYILMAESARAYEPRLRCSIPRPMRSTWARWRSSAAREPGGAAVPAVNRLLTHEAGPNQGRLSG